MSIKSPFSKGVTYAALTALLWGFLPIGVKVALKEVDAISLVWARFAIAFLLLAGYFLIRDRQAFKILIRPPFLLIITALGLMGNYIGYMMGVHLTSPSIAQIVIQIGPVILAASGFLIYKERLTPQRALGFGIAIIGFGLFYRDQLSAYLSEASIFNSGVLLVVFGAVSWSVYAILQKKLLQKYPAQYLNLLIYLLPALVMIPFVDFQTFNGLSAGYWLLTFALGVNTLLAYGCLALALKYTEANKVSIIITTNPVITIIAMIGLALFEVTWIKHEQFTALGLIGAAMVVSGAALAVLRKKKAPAEA